MIEARRLICAYLKSVARQKRLTTYKIADLTGFKQPNVHRMLSGNFSPNLDHLIQLCEALDCYIFIIDKDADDDLIDVMKARWNKINEN